jgi:hypothetical protein
MAIIASAIHAKTLRQEVDTLRQRMEQQGKWTPA